MESRFFNQAEWLKEGFIFQNKDGEYILGQGPFTYSDKACPQSLYCPDFFLKNKKPWISPFAIYKRNKKQLSAFLFQDFDTKEQTFKEKIKVKLNGKTQKNNTGAKSDFFSNSKQPDFQIYKECFLSAKKSIKENLFQKIVPVFCETFFETPNILDFIQRVFKNTSFISNGFLYGLWTKNFGILGFTPEFLFSIKGHTFYTMALAGTGRNSKVSLLTDKKELKEHEFVVQSLEEKLTPFVHLEGKERSEMFFPPLKHLRTDLKGQWLSNFDFEKVCQSLHPTPAVGGYPQKPAWLWLKQQSSQKERSYFASPFAFVESPACAFCLVALRALEWNHRESWIFSGAGLIQESRLEKEWQELALKRQQVKNFFKKR